MESVPISSATPRKVGGQVEVRLLKQEVVGGMVIPVVLGVAGAIQQEPAAVRLARIRSNHSEIGVEGLSTTPGCNGTVLELEAGVPVGMDTTPLVEEM